MRDKTDTTGKQNGESLGAGANSNVSSEALLSLGPENHYGEIPVTRLFLAKYHTYPCTLECETNDDDVRFHVTTILNYLSDELHHDITKDCLQNKCSLDSDYRI
jgi:hypothetical protein